MMRKFVFTSNSFFPLPVLRDRGKCSPGFSFIEVLFAVILLGIGFIMIAGVFPVAIQQTAAVSDETQGAAVVRDAIRKIQALADSEVTGAPAAPGTINSLFQPTNGTVMGFSYALTQALGADAFFTADHRFAWVGFYRRDSNNGVPNPYAQIFVIALKNPNFANYITPYAWSNGTPTLISGALPTQPMTPPWASVPPPIPPNTFYAAPPPNAGTPPGSVVNPTGSSVAPIYDALHAPVTPADYYASSSEIMAILYYDPTSQISSVTFFTASATGSTPPNAVTGAFLLVSNDNFLPSSGYAGFLNGRIFRLGAQIPTPSPVSLSGHSNLGLTFALQPGYDLLSDLYTLGLPNPSVPQEPWGGGGGGGNGVEFFLIGRAFPVPSANSAPPYTYNYNGPDQDIAAGSAFIRVNTSNN